nr:MAG TPA: hypothetical protein [Caudoviricetes sp.]DAZ80930.1 MAG TPA: hypothetical protein [Caudoviricetes sp.]
MIVYTRMSKISIEKIVQSTKKHVDKVCTWCYIENVQSTKEVSTW